MKRTEVEEYKIGENRFFVRRFPAFTAANISGELIRVLSPILSTVAVALGNFDASAIDTTNMTLDDISKMDISNVMDMDIEKIVPSLSNALAGVSGNELQEIIEKLIVRYDNVSVNCEATDWNTARMTKDLADEVFCGDIQDMYILCFYVIKLNFRNFFKRFGSLFGSRTGDEMTEKEH